MMVMIRGGILALPDGPQYLNHLGTVHASALMALAEAASGELLLKEFGSVPGLVPVVRRFESKFRKPAKGSVTAAANIAPGALDDLRTLLDRKGRAGISVGVELHDDSGTHVLTAKVDWFLQRVEGRSTDG